MLLGRESSLAQVEDYNLDLQSHPFDSDEYDTIGDNQSSFGMGDSCYWIR